MINVGNANRLRERLARLGFLPSMAGTARVSRQLTIGLPGWTPDQAIDIALSVDDEVFVDAAKAAGIEKVTQHAGR